MKQTKAKLSIATLFITAIACFVVAITGMLTGFSGTATTVNADITPVKYNVSYTNTNDSVGEGIVTKELPADGATKVTFGYTVKSCTNFPLTLRWQAINGTAQATTAPYAGNDDDGSQWTGTYGKIDQTNELVFDLTTNEITFNKTHITSVDNLSTYSHFGLFWMNNSGMSAEFEMYAYDDTGKDLGVIGSHGAGWVVDDTLETPNQSTYLTTFSNGDYQVVTGSTTTWSIQGYQPALSGIATETDGVLKITMPSASCSNIGIRFGKTLTAEEIAKGGDLIIRFRYESDNYFLKYQTFDGWNQKHSSSIELRGYVSGGDANSVADFVEYKINGTNLANMLDADGELKGIQFGFPRKGEYENVYFDSVRYEVGYKVIFNSNGGSAVETQNVLDGTTVSAPVDPTKDGYYFAGWFTDEEFSDKYDFNSKVTKNITLYAKYEQATIYKLVSKTNGNNDINKWSTAEEPSDNATKVTIKFKTIARDSVGRHAQMLVTDGTTEENSQFHGAYQFNNSWSPVGETVTYEYDLVNKTGKLIGSDGKTNVMSITWTGNPTKFGCLWYKNTSMKGLSALFEIIAVDDTGKDLGVTTTTDGLFVTTGDVYKITVNANNETTTTDYVLSNTVYAEPTAIKDGHIFKGWYTDEGLTTAYDFSKEVTSDITLYAKWVSVENVKTYTVAINSEAIETATKHFEASSRLPRSADATKIYIEYTLGNDDDAGHSFLFDKCAGTMVAAWRTADLWNDKDGFAQGSSHIWHVNNAALYTASYKVIFDLVTNQMVWYRGNTIILEGTGTDFANAIQFGFYTGTAAGEGSMSIKIYDDMGKDLGVTSRILKDTTIDFPKATFDVNYDGGEDVVLDVTQATVTAPENVYRNGYKLVGWYADAECNTEFDFTKEIAGDITLYAKWEEIPQVTVTFNTNGGTAVDPQTINIDTTATEPTTTKTGFVIEGWYTDSDCTLKFNFATTIGENITLYAKWAVQTFTVSFYTNGGSTIENATVEYGNTVTAPTAPTKPGFDFVGWYANEELTNEYDFDTEIFADTTIYAKWVEATYTVTFNTNGGSTIDAQTFNYGDTLSEPTAPTKAGYTFMGWYLDEALSRKANFPISVEGNMTVYAKWEVVVFTVSFDTDSDTVIADAYVNSGATVAKPVDPVKDGYTFEGWYLEVNGEDEFDFNTPITSNITLYARWKAIPANTAEGCGSSLGGNSIAIGGVMLAAAAFIAIKGLKKKED